VMQFGESDRIVSGKVVCRQYHTGVLCEECESGTGKVGDLCYPCGETQWLLLCGYILGFVFVLLYMVKSSFSPASLHTTMFSILLDYMQMTFFISAFNFRFPESTMFIFKLTSFVTLGDQYMGMSCTVSRSYATVARMYHGIALAIVVMFILLLLLYWVTVFIHRSKLNAFAGNATRATVVCALFMYATFSSKALEAFHCFDVHALDQKHTHLSDSLLDNADPELVSVLWRDASVRCNSSDHRYTQILALAVLVLYAIGIPSVIIGIDAFIRRRARKQIQEIDMDSVNDNHIRSVQSTNRLPAEQRNKRSAEEAIAAINENMLFSFLSTSYRPEMFWWPLMALLQKGLLVSIGVFSAGDSTMQSFLALCLLLFTYSMQLIARPYLQLKSWRTQLTPELQGTMYAHAFRLLVKLGPTRLQVWCFSANIVTLLTGPLFADMLITQRKLTFLTWVIYIANIPLMLLLLLVFTVVLIRFITSIFLFCKNFREKRNNPEQQQPQPPPPLQIEQNGTEYIPTQDTPWNTIDIYIDTRNNTDSMTE